MPTDIASLALEQANRNADTVAAMRDTVAAVNMEIELLKARMRVIETLLTEIRRDLALVVRNPDVAKQEIATGMRSG